jgi:hypothetical protein
MVARSANTVVPATTFHRRIRKSRTSEKSREWLPMTLYSLVPLIRIIGRYWVDEFDRQVSAAIKAAEKDTSGEIVVVLAHRSDDYLHVPLHYAAAAALALRSFCIWVVVS